MKEIRKPQRIKAAVKNLPGRFWNYPKLVKAMYITYGDQITIPKSENTGHNIKVGNKIHAICNRCGYGKRGEWTPLVSNLLRGRGCPRCNEAHGHYHRASYQEVQKRLDKMGRHIWIVPINNKMYRNQNTKVWAYNYKTRQLWQASVNALLQMKNAPRQAKINQYYKKIKNDRYADNALKTKIANNSEVN